jgi:predicted nucleic acid-binding protein
VPSVIDASIAAKWLLRDERSKAADALLETVGREGALVPGSFTFEIENILLVAERRKRIDASQVREALDLLATLEIAVEPATAPARERRVELARRHALTSYDAAYLELAAHGRLTLYTADERLAGAARAEDVASVLVR